MADLLTHIERSLAVDVDLDLEPQCEGRAHASVQLGHDGEAARFLVKRPCPCPSFLLCAGRVAHVRRREAIQCSRCGEVDLTVNYRFIEL